MELLDYVYSINGEIFEPVYQPLKKYQEVSIYAEKLDTINFCKMAETDEHCALPDGEESSEDMPTSEDGVFSIVGVNGNALGENKIILGENEIKLGENEIKLGESEIKLVSKIVSKDEMNVTNSEDSFEASLDTEAKLFVLLDSYYKITLTSYNSMAATGSGSRHCFICNTEVEPDVFKQHIDHHDHKNNMQKYKFLDKYKNNLIRQSRLTYHCAICNVIVHRSDLPAHLECNPHKQLMKQNSAITKKQRKNQMKAGLALYKVETQNEVIYKKMKEKQIIFHWRAIITD